MEENRVLEFGLSKKLAPAPSGSSGMIMKSITTNAFPAEGQKDSPLCVMNVNTRSAEGNKAVREAAGFFGIAKGSGIKIVGKGKSVSVEAAREEGRGAFDRLMAFAATLPFANTDAKDAIDFYNKYLSEDGVRENFKLQPSMAGLTVVSIEATEGVFLVRLSAMYTAPLREEDVLGAIRPAADDYDVGILMPEA